MSLKPVAAGKSSFDLINTEKTLKMLDPKPGALFLDLACGNGQYTLEIAKRVGEQGHCYAVDLWQEGLESLVDAAKEMGISNITPLLADITKPLPIESETIDACLMATVLHDLSIRERPSALLEVARVLKPEGRLDVIEFKIREDGPGPPASIRMDEKAVGSLVIPIGFKEVSRCDIGDFNYLLQYKRIA